MASKYMFVIVAVLLAVHTAISQAKEFIVGDDAGWTNQNFDYQAWAKDKVFHVGDTLVFNYKPGAHNVLQVDGAGFKSCAATPDTVPFTTGEDAITLSSPGKKWYICGVAQHCEKGGQKLVINVEAGESLIGDGVPTPAAVPGGPNSANGVVTSAVQVVLAVIMASLVIAMA